MVLNMTSISIYLVMIAAMLVVQAVQVMGCFPQNRLNAAFDENMYIHRGSEGLN